MARKGLSPVQRTMQALRGQGIVCAVVEKFNQHAGPFGIRQDLFGIVDVLALDPARGFLGVQVCGTDFQPHVNKLRTEGLQACLDWLNTPGGHLELWGWRKIKARKQDGTKGKAEVWAPRIQVIDKEFLGLGNLNEEE